MPLSLTWEDDEHVHGGWVERAFSVQDARGSVPALFWRPAASGRLRPGLMLLGHGGSGHKRSDQIVGLGRWFAGRAGVAAVAIDGPYHGDRVPAAVPAPVYQALIAQEGIEAVVNRMVVDWRAVVDALDGEGLVDGARLGYHGMSMGARFGLPLAADLGGRLRCLVIGKFGLEQNAAMDPRLMRPQLFKAAARSVFAPTLFHVQWDDAIFPRSRQLELFGLLASRTKRLIGCSGPHTESPPDAVQIWQAFAARHLG